MRWVLWSILMTSGRTGLPLLLLLLLAHILIIGALVGEVMRFGMVVLLVQAAWIVACWSELAFPANEGVCTWNWRSFIELLLLEGSWHRPSILRWQLMLLLLERIKLLTLLALLQMRWLTLRRLLLDGCSLWT